MYVECKYKIRVELLASPALLGKMLTSTSVCKENILELHLRKGGNKFKCGKLALFLTQKKSKKK